MNAKEVEEFRALVQVASSSMGPCGSAKAVRTSDAPGAQIVISSHATRILPHWRAPGELHIVNYVLETVSSHLKKHQDGGWTLLNFSLRAALALLGVAGGDEAVSRPAALRGLAHASQWLDEALSASPCRRRMDWTSLESASSLVNACLCKPLAPLDPAAMGHLSRVLMEAFIERLPAKAADVASPLRYMWVSGPEVNWSSLLKGLVLDTPAMIPKRQKQGDQPLLCALFSVSLEQWYPARVAELSEGALGVEQCVIETVLGNVSLDSAQDGEDGAGSELRRWELVKFKELADSLLSAGVRILACQKLIDPWLCDYMTEHGVVVLPRLSLRHIDAVQRLSGAAPIGSLAALPKQWSSVLGTVGSVELMDIYGKRYTTLRSCAESQQRPCTLLIGAPDDHALSELKACIPQAIHALEVVASSGAVVDGGGLVELALADALTAKAQEELRSQTMPVQPCRAVLIIANCLRDVAACLMPEGCTASSKHSFMDAARSVLTELEETGSMPAGGVLEPYSTKRCTLLAALDLAGILVRYGGTLDTVSHKVG